MIGRIAAIWLAVALLATVSSSVAWGAYFTLIPGLDRLSVEQSATSRPTVPDEPQLRLEIGSHSTRILSLAVDGAGRWLVTSGADKTARVWDIATGRLIGVLRPPVGGGVVGDISRVAISRDGTLVAVSWRSESSASILLFDRVSAQVRLRIEGLADVVSDMHFSPNGQLLAATVVSGGLQLFGTSDGRERGRDTAYGGDSYSVDFSPNGGWLLTSCLDGLLRLYDIGDGRLKKVAQAAAGKARSKPLNARFSPDGLLIAVGFDQMGGVAIWRATDLTFASDVGSLTVSSNMPELTWSSDGKYLYAVGLSGSGEVRVRRWSSGPMVQKIGSMFNLLSSSIDIPIKDAGGIVANPVALPDGGIIVGTEAPAWGVITTGGEVQWRHKAPQSRHAGYVGGRLNPSGLLLSPDGNQVGFSYQSGSVQATSVFNLTTASLGPEHGGGSPARASGPGLSTKVDSSGLKLNGNVVPALPGEHINATAVVASAASLAVGSTLALRLYDATARLLWRREGWVDAVNASADGRWVVADFADGTIRWFRSQDGVEVLALYPHPDGRRWILWTPSGYYDCSVAGEDLIGWQLNHGLNAAGDFFPISRFRGAFYRPDVIAKVLETADSDQALAMANQESGRPAATHAEMVQRFLPPVVTVLTPMDGATTSSQEVKLRVSVRTPNDAPVTGIRARAEGRPLAVTMAKEPAAGKGASTGKGSVPASIASSGEQIRDISVQIPPHDVEIEVFADNRNAVSTPAIVRLVWAGESVAEPASRGPNLYVLAVGVSRYNNPDYRLEFAAQDATDFAQTMQAQKGAVYRDVRVTLLTDGNATHDRVLQGLEWLRTNVTPQDIGMVLLAGHGLNDKQGKYFYAPANIDLGTLTHTGVVFSDIQRAMANIPGKAVFFVDTCHAGNALGGRRVDMTGMINELSSAENGVVVFSASTGNQVSFEDAAWGHGAFTKAVLEGISGRADYNKNGRITVKTMDLYLSDRVSQLTQGQQTPVIIAPFGVADFQIASAK